MSYNVVNILDLIEMLGEAPVQAALSDFSCPKNPDIERFLQQNAIPFARRKISMTHLVFDQASRITGYFTITHKPLVIAGEDRLTLSKTDEKTIRRYSELDETTQSYTLSAFLIAQFGKNFALPAADQIRGTQLMQAALIKLKTIQREIGGGVVFLECEDREKLLAFYQSPDNRFKRYSQRHSETEDKYYIQLLRFF